MVGPTRRMGSLCRWRAALAKGSVQGSLCFIASAGTLCCVSLPQTLDGKVEAGPPGLWKLTQHVQQQEEQLAATKAALVAAQVRRWVPCRRHVRP